MQMVQCLQRFGSQNVGNDNGYNPFGIPSVLIDITTLTES